MPRSVGGWRLGQPRQAVCLRDFKRTAAWCRSRRVGTAVIANAQRRQHVPADIVARLVRDAGVYPIAGRGDQRADWPAGEQGAAHNSRARRDLITAERAIERSEQWDVMQRVYQVDQVVEGKPVFTPEWR